MPLDVLGVVIAPLGPLPQMLDDPLLDVQGLKCHLELGQNLGQNKVN